jgi:uncharacterized protein (DUF1015 family)
VIPEPAGLVLAPFRGVRYAPDRVSGLAEVTSPPYDVLGAAAAERLRAEDPHNVVRLTLPADCDGEGDGDGDGDGRPHDRYGVAGRTLREWIADGVLVPDPNAGLYVYEERAHDAAGSRPGAWAGLQRGLIGAIALTAPAAGIVLPHEGVTPVVVADRRKLMEATQANLEPIFLLYQGGGAASQLVDEVAETQPPTIEAVADGVTHRLWAVTDAAAVAAAAADLAHRQAVIADGHHRYAAYLELQAQRHAAGLGSGPWDYGLALLVDSNAYPPLIDPIHRVVADLRPATAAGLAESAFTVRTLPSGTDLGSALRVLRDAGHGWDAAAPDRSAPGGAGLNGFAPGAAGLGAGGNRTAFLLAGDGAFRLLTDPDPVKLAAAAPAGRSARWLRLDTSVLHELLLREIWRIRGDQSAVRMVHQDAAAAIDAAGPGGTAVICNPPQVTDVLALAARGEQMPRKSTSFGPKPRTGLVIRSFAYR